MASFMAPALLCKTRRASKSWYQYTTWAGFFFSLVGLELGNSQNQRQLGTFWHHFRTILAKSRKLLDRFQKYCYQYTRHCKGYASITCFSRFKNFLIFMDFAIPMTTRPSKFNFYNFFFKFNFFHFVFLLCVGYGYI